MIGYTLDMELDFDYCYRAIQSRDTRFDGHFITAVTSTGIYCRPICPAQTPHPENVRFYTCAAAAEAAGFRACRRCRPETSIGSPDWNVRADLTARALRLIADGVADDEGIAGLARRLAVSARHLHRELVATVGVGPLALARTRRAQTARMLIDQTALPMTDIAFAAGFASIRQFNETMLTSFGCAPTAFRRQTPATDAGGGALVLRLPYRAPFDGAALLEFLARRAIAGIEEVTGGVYRRTVRLQHSCGTIELTPMTGKAAISLRVQLDDLRDLGQLTARARHLFDLEMDPTMVAAVLGADPLLAPLIAAHPGLRVPGAIDGFEMAVRAIIGQQIAVAGARTILGKLVAQHGAPLPGATGTLTRLFPTPATLAEADLTPLLPRVRAASLRSLSQAVAEGRIMLDRGADREATRTQLLSVPGIGPWTANYIAMRALGDPDAWPETDLGICHAAERLGLDVAALAARSVAWHPWRAYAALHLWTSLSDDQEITPAPMPASRAATLL